MDPSVADTVAAFGVESPVYAAIRFAQFTAITVLIGALVLVQVVLPKFIGGELPHHKHGEALSGTIVRRALRWIQFALLALAVSTGVRLAAQHIVFFEDARWSMETMRPLLLLSGWGHGWLLAASAIGLGLFTARMARQRRRGSWVILSVLAFALAFSLSMSGHAAAAPTLWLAMSLDAVHVVAAGGWIGSLAMLLVLALPTVLQTVEVEGHRAVARLIAAFSPAALSFAFLLGVTGTVAGWRNVGSWSALTGSAYGQLLVVKLLLVGVVAAAGAVNWRRILPSLGQRSATRTLRRSAAFELLMALGILALTAVLVATPTPS